MRGERDSGARETFLAAIRRGETVTGAAKLAGVSRQAPYNWVNRGDCEVAAAMAQRRTLSISATRKPRKRAPKPVETGTKPPETAPKPSETPEFSNEDLTRLAKAALAGLLEDEDPKIRAKATEIAAKHFRHAELPVGEPAEEAEDEPGELSPEDAAARFRVVG